MSFNHWIMKLKSPDKIEGEIRERIEYCIKGDNTFYTARTREVAEEGVKRLVAEARQAWKEYNDEQRKHQVYLEELELKLRYFIQDELDGRKTSSPALMRAQVRDKLRELMKAAKKYSEG